MGGLPPGASLLPNCAQKEKKARRTQRDKAAAKAIERGEEPAPMAIPRVSRLRLTVVLSSSVAQWNA